MVVFHSYVSLPEGSIETYAFGLPPVVTYKLPETSTPLQQRLLGMLFLKKRQCFSEAVKGERVLSVVFTKVFVCTHAELQNSMECSKCMVFDMF